MILPVGYKQWKRREALHDLITRFPASETLEQLLKYKPGRDDALSDF